MKPTADSIWAALDKMAAEAKAKGVDPGYYMPEIISSEQSYTWLRWAMQEVYRLQGNEAGLVEIAENARRDADKTGYGRGWNAMKVKAIKQVYLSYGTRGNLPLSAIAEAIEGWTPEGWTPPNPPPAVKP